MTTKTVRGTDVNGRVTVRRETDGFEVRTWRIIDRPVTTALKPNDGLSVSPADSAHTVMPEASRQPIEKSERD